LNCVEIQQLIAENCETVEEALEIIKKVPLSFPKNFFIADRF
jgi:predicted choloylglycine hydrolase